MESHLRDESWETVDSENDDLTSIRPPSEVPDEVMNVVQPTLTQGPGLSSSLDQMLNQMYEKYRQQHKQMDILLESLAAVKHRSWT